MTDSCATCRFFLEDGDFDGVKVGQCRRRPPRGPQHGPWRFPRVMSTSWCGEYEPTAGEFLKRVDCGHFHQSTLPIDA